MDKKTKREIPVHMKRSLRFWLLGVCVLLMPSTMRAVPGDEHWDARFNWPGTPNEIFAIATNNGKLYCGGVMVAQFLTNAPLEVWDGNQWSSMGTFTAGPTGTTSISDIAVLNGTLFVAGNFTNVNGAGIAGLAKWNGSAWINAGISGVVYALAIDGNNLYAAGGFTNVDGGGAGMTNIGYFDGSQWHALGGGVGSSSNGFARALAVKSGQVYVGGYFTNSGSQAITNIALWNGSGWVGVGGGIPSLIVYALAFNGSDLYAGGIFTQAGSTSVNNIARWDGANWWSVGGGVTGSSAAVYSLAAFNGMMCAGGLFTNAGALTVANFAVWNGATWSAANGGVSATTYRIFNNGTNVYVGGNLLLANNQLMDSITSWDGTNWSAIGTPGRLNGIYAIALQLASDGTNVYAGGSSLNWAGQTNVNLVAHFDGTNNWSALGTGITGSSVITGPIGPGVLSLAVSSNLVYAGGNFTAAGGVSASNIAVWNGSIWSAMSSGPGGVVFSILPSTNGVYAVGAPFYNTSYYNSPFFSLWNGSNWQSVPINFPQYTDWQTYISSTVGMDALAVIGTNLFIGGYFSLGEYANFPNGYTNCNNILRFDGTTAWIMGTGLNSNVTAMVALGTNLYVAGNFTNAGGVAASKIAMWNGTYWTNVGSGVVGTGVINRLATVGANLYAGGTFTNIGGVHSPYLAKWDGTNWNAMGSGISNPGAASSAVNGLTASGNSLYVSGNFRMAGDKPSFYIARWNDQVNFDTPQLTALPPSNGLFRMLLTGAGVSTNIIQASTDFITWTPVLTNSTGIYNFTDSNSAAYPFRYYRAFLSQ